MALSDAWLKTNNGKLRDKVEVVADRDSLSVRISPKGKIVFQYRYRFNGKAKRIDVGTYPLMSLKDARNQIINYQIELDQGKDPLQLKLKEEVIYISQPTVKQICCEWFDVIAKDKVSVECDKRAFEIHVYPRLGKRICDEVTLQEWSKLLFTIAGYAKTVSVKILGNLKMIMRWGSPLHQQQQISAEQAHFNEIFTAHPDAESIVESQEFGNWIGKQPSFVQSAYETVLKQGNAAQVVELLGLYKAETQSTQAAQPNDVVKAAAQQAVKQAQTPVPHSLL